MTGASGLLDDAIEYALGAVRTVSPPLLTSPTPCSDWDLRALLQHLNEALDVLGCNGVPAVSVLSRDQLFTDPWLIENDVFRDVDDHPFGRCGGL